MSIFNKKVLSTGFLAMTLLAGCNSMNQMNLDTKTVKQNAVSQSLWDANEYQEQYRPQIHFSPLKHWMNDPNGMVYYQGEYHLFYQYHPESTVWGPMHWGHAVSTDLVNWEELPIALFPDEFGTIFSGSAVIDWNNTSGLGTADNPPMVAIFTYHDAEADKMGAIDFQTQGLAFSLDKGRTWKKYANNPVMLNPGKRDFRDPKVSWNSKANKWIMVLAEGQEIGFYSSDNLLNWKLESHFGQGWGNHSGVWECPDLISLQVDENGNRKDVLIVSIGAGGPNGGSATQYFIGEFDGHEYVLDPTFQDELQQTPAVFPEGEVFDDFEHGLEKWDANGEAFASSPTRGSYTNQAPINGYVGEYLINSFNNGDKAIGSLLSKPFVISKGFINFYIGGGQHPNKVGMQLIIDDVVVRSATGQNSEQFRYVGWDVNEFVGQTARIKIIDSESGSWGHTYIDQIVFSDALASNRIEPAVWLDFGTDNYAGVTFSDMPDSDGRSILMGWMSNWQYANKVPTRSFRSAMTLPRTLSLKTTSQGLRLTSLPVKEVVAAEQVIKELGPLSGQNTYLLNSPSLSENAFRVSFALSNTRQQKINIELFNLAGDKVITTLDTVNASMTLDRTQSGDVSFDEGFAGVQYAPFHSMGNKDTVDIIVDHSSIEIFINDGESVITALVFPQSILSGIRLSSDENFNVNDAKIAEFSSMWISSEQEAK
ncbi:glycoside hydrolase family 32 protein [Paraglaciecola sp.]|uniref:glycoside hydrolase family 32 protein n=1 Tax=Paraglaciecola sp. TaxID=1920173 RepID=UPI00273ECC65|nr:glycoside hydrolase family 32 protein [Paraglaciecola sp.]